MNKIDIPARHPILEESDDEADSDREGERSEGFRTLNVAEENEPLSSDKEIVLESKPEEPEKIKLDD